MRMSGALQMRRQQGSNPAPSAMALGHCEILSLYCQTAGKTANPIPPGFSHGPEGYTTRKERFMPEKKEPFKQSHRAMLRCRGMKAKDYEFVKETYTSLYVRNVHTGVVKILQKHN